MCTMINDKYLSVNYMEKVEFDLTSIIRYQRQVLLCLPFKKKTTLNVLCVSVAPGKHS